MGGIGYAVTRNGRDISACLNHRTITQDTARAEVAGTPESPFMRAEKNAERCLINTLRPAATGAENPMMSHINALIQPKALP